MIGSSSFCSFIGQLCFVRGWPFSPSSSKAGSPPKADSEKDRIPSRHNQRRAGKGGRGGHPIGSSNQGTGAVVRRLLEYLRQNDESCILLV